MKHFFTKKRLIWLAVLLAIGGIVYVVTRPKNVNAIQTEPVTRQDLQQTVLTTGQVVSDASVNLSFLGSGVIRRMNVKEGDRVKAGDVLALLDQTSAQASLTSARGALAQAQANYERVIRGSTDQQIAVSRAAVDAAQVALDNAKKSLDQVTAQQNLLVANAYSSVLNSGLAAIPSPSNLSSLSPMVNGVYTGSSGQYKIQLFDSGTGLRYQLSGLESSQGPVS
ncbi:MAG TPA: biotin/lipoyl-binding protein, partial [Patescibacteria group bacterium]|nr:biotin/lipoyl-binding protein [Patescibacteria group bacterium]